MLDVIEKTVMVINPKDIVDFFWSVPYWKTLADPNDDANKGMVRHGGVEKIANYVPNSLKPDYREHAQRYLNHMDDPKGAKPRTLLAWGTRNTFQNLGLPGWHRIRTPKLLHRIDEPWQTWVYHALCKFASEHQGQGCETALGIRAVKFESTPGQSDRDCIALIEKGRDVPKTVEWAVTGQPILWDGEVPPMALLAACTYDLRHVYHLLWEKWQWEKWPEYKRHHEIHTELMNAFMKHLNSPIQSRAEALSMIASREELAVTDGYLHSSIGLREDGTLVLLLMHGSLRDLGYTHKALGSQRAILLDNGGSVGLAYWPKQGWKANKWGDNVDDKPSPTYFGNGSYFRPRAHALLVAELREDIIEPPFAPRPLSGKPWACDPDEERTTIAVLGGGVAGTAIAYELVEKGFQVTLLYRNDEEGSSATNQKWMHSGFLYPSEHLAKKAWRTFRMDWILKEPHVLGKRKAHFIALNQQTLDEKEELWKRWGMDDRGLLVNRLSSAQWSEIVAHCSALQGTNCIGGFRAPDCVVDFPGLARDMRERLERKGGRILAGATIQRLCREGNAVTGVEYKKDGQTQPTILHCEHCIVAMGAWSLDLLREIAVNPPLIRKKCIIFTYDADDLVPCITVCLDIRKQDGSLADVTLVPFQRQTLAAGTSFELVDPLARTDSLFSCSDQEVAAVKEELIQCFPVLRRYEPVPRVCIKTEEALPGAKHPDVDMKMYCEKSEQGYSHGVAGLAVAIPGKASLMFDLARKVAEHIRAEIALGPRF